MKEKNNQILSPIPPHKPLAFLGSTTVDDGVNVINGQGCLGDVGAQNDFPHLGVMMNPNDESSSMRHELQRLFLEFLDTSCTPGWTHLAKPSLFRSRAGLPQVVFGTPGKSKSGLIKGSALGLLRCLVFVFCVYVGFLSKVCYKVFERFVGFLDSNWCWETPRKDCLLASIKWLDRSLSFIPTLRTWNFMMFYS